ncbi:MAG: hypothetical protein RQ741_07500, partial [Wenzhouxiangellaceae bacterium]|nr:hypothetical protein [Wenzhouxiangellaceae bacterium]
LSWVEPDRRILELAAARGLDARAIADSPYRFLATTEDVYSVIAFDHVFDGGGAATESYLLTRQGLVAALSRLDDNGLLAIPLKLDYPPRQGPRMMTMLAASLRASGVDRPGDHVVVLRGMQALLLLASPRPFAETELEAIGRFAEQWSFDRAWHTGLEISGANQHHLLDEPVYFKAAQAAFEGTAMPEQAQWFETRPATLNRPYFWHAMKWSRLSELFQVLGSRAASYLDWTLVMSAVALVAAAFAAAALIIAPLGRMPQAAGVFRRIDVIGYFGLLGLGFMLVELAVLQRSIAFLELPVLAAAVIFAVFMVGAGLGSAMLPASPGAPAIRPVFSAMAIGTMIAVTALWWPGQALLELEFVPRVAMLVGVLLPLTWAMGRPFPWGLQQLSTTPIWLPWSWAVNGFSSVLAASMATLLSVQAGQAATLIVGIGCYAGAWLIARRRLLPASNPALEFA